MERMTGIKGRMVLIFLTGSTLRGFNWVKLAQRLMSS